MKRFISLIILIALATPSMAGLRRSRANLVVPATYPLGRNATTLTNLIDLSNGKEAHYLIDGGTFIINKDVAWPTNVTVEMTEGSHFIFTNSAVMTWNTNTFIAGNYMCFTGDGTNVGGASFPHSCDNWPDGGDYDLGAGYADESTTFAKYYLTNQVDDLIVAATNSTYINAVAYADSLAATSITNQNNRYIDGTTQNFYNVIIRDELIVSDDVIMSSGLTVSGNLAVASISGTSITGTAITASTMNVGGVSITNWTDISALQLTNTLFCGYPEVTLTTNMIGFQTDLHSPNSKGITNATWVNAFDDDTNTWTDTWNLDGAGGRIVSGVHYFDLGNIYEGFVLVDFEYDPGPGVGDSSRAGFSISSSLEPPTFSVEPAGTLVTVLTEGGTQGGVAVNGSMVFGGYYMGIHATGDDDYRHRKIAIISGRYLILAVGSYNSSSDVVRFCRVKLFALESAK